MRRARPRPRHRRPGRRQGHRPRRRVRAAALPADLQRHHPGHLRRRAAAHRRDPHRAHAAHTESGSAVSVVTAHLADPTGYGRIVRDAEGRVEKIVEQKDATDAEQRDHRDQLGHLRLRRRRAARRPGPRRHRQRAGREVPHRRRRHRPRAAATRCGRTCIDDLWQTEGVNDRVQLAALGRELNRRVCEQHMRAGVTIVDPATTWIDVDVTIGRDTTVLPGHPAARGHQRSAPTPSSGPR